MRKLKHSEYERKASGYPELETIPIERLMSWMTTKLGLGSEWVGEFERSYRQRVLVDAEEDGVVSFFTEEEACKELSHLGLSKRALRKHCLERGKCTRTGRYSWAYDSGYVSELSEVWVRASEVRGTMHRRKSSFHEMRTRRGWTQKRIGHVLLLRKEDLLQ